MVDDVASSRPQIDDGRAEDYDDHRSAEKDAQNHVEEARDCDVPCSMGVQDVAQYLRSLGDGGHRRSCDRAERPACVHAGRALVRGE